MTAAPDPVLAGLAAHLHAVGLVIYDPASEAGNVYFDAMPQTPDRAVCLTLYGGREGDVRNGWDEPRLQVRTRVGKSPADSRAWARDIYEALQGFGGAALADGYWLQDCHGIQSAPEPLGPDEAGRHEHVVNYQLSVDRSTI